MAKKSIYESQASRDAAKRFRMLCEYTFNITEDDGEENMPEEPQEGNMGQEMPQDGMNPQGDNMGQEIPQDGTADNQMMGGNEGAPGFNPQDNMMGNEQEMPVDMEGMDDMGTEPMQPDDEVIDVDELTQAQEETEEKVDDMQSYMGKGFKKLLNVVNKLDQMINNSIANMENIKQEIEKRNPTPMEKLNMRAANDSYPFNVSPNDYWANKEATSNYRIGGEDEEDAPQYTITQGDIDKMTDFQKISKDLSDANFNQNLMNIFGLR
jgi:hypothetical protein